MQLTTEQQAEVDRLISFEQELADRLDREGVPTLDTAITFSVRNSEEFSSFSPFAALLFRQVGGVQLRSPSENIINFMVMECLNPDCDGDHGDELITFQEALTRLVPLVEVNSILGTAHDMVKEILGFDS